MGTSNCKNSNSISKENVDILKNIPILRYPKDPVVYIEDLYKKYPQGGEYGWYSFVTSAGTFAYWDIQENRWKLLSTGDLQSMLDVDVEMLEDGDVPIWDDKKGKFVIANSGLWRDVEW